MQLLISWKVIYLWDCIIYPLENWVLELGRLTNKPLASNTSRWSTFTYMYCTLYFFFTFSHRRSTYQPFLYWLLGAGWNFWIFNFRKNICWRKWRWKKSQGEGQKWRKGELGCFYLKWFSLGLTSAFNPLTPRSD